jgi:aromatic amino acid permease
MWGWPWLAWATMASLWGLVLLMLFDDAARSQVISVAVVTGVLVLLANVSRRAGRRVSSRP